MPTPKPIRLGGGDPLPLLIEDPGAPAAPGSIEDRLAQLERVAHAPVIFVECGRCHAVVFEDAFEAHGRWHAKADARIERPGDFVRTVPL